MSPISPERVQSEESDLMDDEYWDDSISSNSKESNMKDVLKNAFKVCLSI